MGGRGGVSGEVTRGPVRPRPPRPAPAPGNDPVPRTRAHRPPPAPGPDPAPAPAPRALGATASSLQPPSPALKGPLWGAASPAPVAPCPRSQRLSGREGRGQTRGCRVPRLVFGGRRSRPPPRRTRGSGRTSPGRPALRAAPRPGHCPAPLGRPPPSPCSARKRGLGPGAGLRLATASRTGGGRSWRDVCFGRALGRGPFTRGPASGPTGAPLGSGHVGLRLPFEPHFQRPGSLCRDRGHTRSAAVDDDVRCVSGHQGSRRRGPWRAARGPFGRAPTPVGGASRRSPKAPTPAGQGGRTPSAPEPPGEKVNIQCLANDKRVAPAGGTFSWSHRPLPHRPTRKRNPFTKTAHGLLREDRGVVGSAAEPS